MQHKLAGSMIIPLKEAKCYGEKANGIWFTYLVVRGTRLRKWDVTVQLAVIMVTYHMEIFYALLTLSAGNLPVTGEFPSQRPVTRSFDISSDLRLNKWLSKQSWGWWSETPSRSLWRHYHDSQLPWATQWRVLLVQQRRHSLLKTDFVRQNVNDALVTKPVEFLVRFLQLQINKMNMFYLGKSLIIGNIIFVTPHSRNVL